ncbi:oxygen-independent coproporphyrinogen III oxidase [Reichenbachiella carrageenanivorans]|uniref:Coproporphyrinogen-III oxidase n=1 Tax=Reichenbachiella carrageenanivorans TaxID=2979869 RepID=A0ABY6D0A1_9BACT|nr:oxygen-independent coproporphyrinogen III oxidase [Reichenbachiella carrageenanivorans]UXX78493.1 oxygen-independent coproporphyrinogen III oxidase [Reichenbachiella carrageenanivorans]
MATTLTRKYNVPGPRYTSYPSVPFWQKKIDLEGWKSKIKDTFRLTNKSNGISLYIHLPFCESLCTYCGCTTRITINHAVEKPYIDTVLKEWKLYLDLLEDVPEIAEIHLGGGTPTFFSPQNLTYLIEGITQTCVMKAAAEFSFEAHPNNTTDTHLKTLYNLGFRRVSFGIQDFDSQVQQIINRVQTYEQVQKVVDSARAIGYTSINFDLIYGLPLQTLTSISDTCTKVATLQPDRIAFYSYAHVPWIKPGQRMFTEADLPSHESKRSLYELGKQMLTNMGYQEIGMDHFSLPDEALFRAANEGHMHRNFMGYTTQHSLLSIGLGVSAIGDAWSAYGQNLKKVEEYKKAVISNEFPIFKTHLLNDEEAYIRQHITQLMCKFETSWSPADPHAHLLNHVENQLQEMIADELVIATSNHLLITTKGRPFVRNVCMALDIYLKPNRSSQPQFSSTI